MFYTPNRSRTLTVIYLCVKRLRCLLQLHVVVRPGTAAESADRIGHRTVTGIYENKIRIIHM
jgi:hypothetical protein